MEKATCSLEITILSAESLRLDGRSVKKNTFVIVTSDSNNQRSTSMDKDGGSYPSWNEKLEPLPLPNSVNLITVEVQCKKSSGFRTVGTCKIPVSDLMADYTPAHYLHFLSYRLRDRNGERNGIINFSIRMVGSQCFGWSVPPQPLRIPAAAKQKNAASGSGTALGVPVPVPYGYEHGHGHGHGYGYGV
ncbi:hypothetical protein NE237_029544 [Protea cynaroides]|uniref:C2 domain-containing protein n=1 Tax=Protea cynaroides TaxID=273540 RepID=A0A9Q0JV67_9MAGN|nr:hypothetical protein NE237_029544 [Protea cynaroides]